MRRKSARPSILKVGEPNKAIQERWKMGTKMNDSGSISDGYHTFDELYEHRHRLFIALMRCNPEISWRANNHHDGSMYENWFIAGMELPTGQVSYHLPVRLWTALDGVGIQTTNKAPEWDGHNSEDVLKRLEEWKKEQ